MKGENFTLILRKKALETDFCQWITEKEGLIIKRILEFAK